MPMIDDLTTISLRYLQEVPKNGTEQNAFVALWNEKPKSVLTYFATGVVLFFVFYCTLREYLHRKWGIECFPRHRMTPRQQLLEDEHVARELQIEMDEVERREVMDARRLERRLKYLTFLAPFTMVSLTSD